MVLEDPCLITQSATLSDRPVQLGSHGFTSIHIDIDVVKTNQHQAGEERGLYDFECDMVVGARRAGLGISEATHLLGFSCISGVY